MSRRHLMRAASAQIDGQLAAAAAALHSPEVRTGPPWDRGETLALVHVQALSAIATGLSAIVAKLADDEHDDQGDVDEPGAEELGRGAYHAYARAVDGVSFLGQPLREWERLPERIRRGWSDAALWARR